MAQQIARYIRGNATTFYGYQIVWVDGTRRIRWTTKIIRDRATDKIIRRSWLNNPPKHVKQGAERLLK